MSAKNTTEVPAEPVTARPANDESGACCDVERDLRAASTRLLDETRGLRAELTKHAQQHPLATFGIAFAAGLLVARALRR